jgi:hypothetical protein
MALNFNFSNTAWYKTNGTIFHHEEDQYGQHHVLPQLDYIVWAAMFIGMPSITEKNVDVFIDRCRLMDKIAGPIVTCVVDGKRVSAFNADVIRQCIGFRSNASTKTKTEFVKNLLKEYRLG